MPRYANIFDIYYRCHWTRMHFNGHSIKWQIKAGVGSGRNSWQPRKSIWSVNKKTENLWQSQFMYMLGLAESWEHTRRDGSVLRGSGRTCSQLKCERVARACRARDSLSLSLRQRLQLLLRLWLKAELQAQDLVGLVVDIDVKISCKYKQWEQGTAEGGRGTLKGQGRGSGKMVRQIRRL